MPERARLDERDLSVTIQEKAVVLSGMHDLNGLINCLKDKQIVMLGESTHGTLEFYEWRRTISLELIRNHGFQFIAVEGDWPPCQSVNEYIQGTTKKGMLETLREFSRWPTWMWANSTMLDFMDELKDWARQGNTIGFHGLDVYSLFESLDVVLEQLKDIDPELARNTAELYSCLEPYRHDERSYLRRLVHHPDGCRTSVLRALQEILEARLKDNEKVFDAVRNAYVVKNAEEYYRAMISMEDNSWNVRDVHMMETLSALQSHYGPGAKGIVWAHNTHIGDYRATDMLIRGEVNLGGLARERLGKDRVALLGFTTYTGEVIAGQEWDGPMMRMKIPEGRIGTLESAFHEAAKRLRAENILISFKDLPEDSALFDYTGHRAIGVVYRPEFESRGQYVPTKPGHRYDHMIFIDRTHALSPLPVRPSVEKMPETWPYGESI